MATTRSRSLCRSPRWQRTLHHRGLRKNGVQRQCALTERENMPHFTAKNHLIRINGNCGVCCCTPTGMSTTVSTLQRAAPVGSRLSPHHLHPKNLLHLHKWDVEHLVNGLQLGNLSGLLDWTKGNGLCATTVMSTPLTCTITVMSISSPMCAVWHCAYLSLKHTGNVHHSVDEPKRGTIHCRSTKDCWNLSCMFTETSTPSPVPSICKPPWAGGVSPPSVVRTHKPCVPSSANDAKAKCVFSTSEVNETQTQALPPAAPPSAAPGERSAVEPCAESWALR